METPFFDDISSKSPKKRTSELRECIKKEKLARVRFKMAPEIAKYDELDDILSNICTINPQQVIDFILTKFTPEDSRYIFSLIIMFSLIRPLAIGKLSKVFSLLMMKRHCVFNMLHIYKENPIFLRHLIDDGCYKEDNEYETFVSLNIPLDYSPKSIEYFLKYDDIESFKSITGRPNFTFKSFVTTNNFDFFMKEEEISMLSFCALYGSYKCFRLLLNNNGRITLETCECAARGGNIDIIKCCKKNGGIFSTGLEHAIRCHQKEAFDWLLANSKCEIPTICVCAQTMNIASVYLMLLFDNLVEVDTVDNFCHTALHYACKSSFFPIVELLLSKNASTGIRDEMGRTALHYASKGFNTKIVDLLVKNGSNISDKDNFGKTALHFACESGNFSTVNYLIDHGAEVNERADNVEETALHLAAEHGHTDIVTYLLEYGADIESRADFVGRREYMNAMTPFHFSCVFGEFKTGYELFLRKANIKALNGRGMSALHLACKGNNIEFVEFLVNNGLNVSTRDDTGMQPIHYAARHCNKEIVAFLISHGADIMSLNNNKQTCLHLCCESPLETKFEKSSEKNEYDQFHSALNSKLIISNIESRLKNRTEAKVTKEVKREFIKYLVSLKCDVNAVDNRGQTPLHCACIACDIYSVAALISLGSKVTAEDNNGLQPYNITDDYSIKQFLVSKQNETKCRIA